MKVKTLLLYLVLCIVTSSCSGTYHAYYQTLKIAFSQAQDAQVTLAAVKQSKVDLIAVKRGERATATMALAYLENNQHKWVSNDNAMLVMEKGRIIRTLGFKKNLLFMANTKNDPLKSLPQEINSKSNTSLWSTAIDLNQDEYSHPIESTFGPPSQQTLVILGQNIATRMYVENLSYQAPAKYIQLTSQWQNYFWYAEDGTLIKSKQQISPITDAIEITYLSRAARISQVAAD